ncbi:nuclease-related domain-containing protein [Geotalea sp. SG265]|uniref:nuclease-related domain-containing protein n=1 Tax=Geotalea sp. SG265 TaxID=2922867 RepID=UPI001FAFB5E3|nr:nuclease-related domain-containing protein [Geotalea sp. SG265]
MILKARDGRDEDIQELNRLLTLDLSGKQRFLVERELKCLKSGNSGESSSAYYLDFGFKNSKNWVVIHDLRIEHRGLVAQIDHLLINRFLEVYVLESKNYFYGVKITDGGEFLAYNGKTYQGVESPIEQNKRHINLLQQSILDRNLSPTRLGVPIPISFKNHVLVAPNARVDRPPSAKFDSSPVIKADAFATFIEKDADSRSVVSVFASAAKVIGTDTLEEFGQKLIRLHRPGKFDYIAKFGVSETKPAPITKESVEAGTTSTEGKSAQVRGEKTCIKCGIAVDKKVVFFCNINKSRFKEQILCRDCQQGYPA